MIITHKPDQSRQDAVRVRPILAELFWIVVPLIFHLGLTWFNVSSHSIVSTFVASIAASVVTFGLVVHCLRPHLQVPRLMFNVPGSGFVHYIFLWCVLTGVLNFLADGSIHSRMIGSGMFLIFGFLFELALASYALIRARRFGSTDSGDNRSPSQ